MTNYFWYTFFIIGIYIPFANAQVNNEKGRFVLEIDTTKNPVIMVKEPTNKNLLDASPSGSNGNTGTTYNTFCISDIPIMSSTTITQSENSVFISRSNKNVILNSNNSTNWPVTEVLGVSGYVSNNGGTVWNGSVPTIPNLSRSDPAVVISKKTGRYFIGNLKPNSTGGYAQIVQFSDDGQSWIYRTLTNNNTDKNHLWVDNRQNKSDGSSNPFYGQLYSAWRDMSGGEIFLSFSTDNGLSWSLPAPISTASDYNNGVNIKTGTNGEVFAVWAIYDNPQNEFYVSENEIGFAKSFDGGVTWEAKRIQPIYEGLSEYTYTYLGGGKTMRVNSFPSMAVNMQTGELYVVWAEGIDGAADIFFIKSSNQGETWSNKRHITNENSNDQWLPWIACDEITGCLVVIYYDSRNFSENDKAETFVSISCNEGQSWKDYLVSDDSWNADAMVGVSNRYAGDYLGIDIYDSKVVPVWSDDRTGNLLAYAQPFDIEVCSVKDLTLCSITHDNQNETYQARNTITAGGTNCGNFIINNNGSNEVVMKAGKQIILKHGFHAKGNFHAFGEDCYSVSNTSSNCPDFKTNNITNNNFDTKAPPQLPSTQPSFTLHPNPSDGNFELQIKNYESGINNAVIKIYDLLGREVYSSNILNQTTEIDINNQRQGIYVVKVVLGEEAWWEKMVVR